jgi:hypothetical protein
VVAAHPSTNTYSFGRDERTGEEIAFERFDLIPWARQRIEERDAR